MQCNSATVAVSLVVSTKALINFVLVAASLVVRVATVAVRVATDSQSWAVAEAKLVMASTVSCWKVELG